ncbi:MAG: hypothetical protein ABSF27_09075 [Candidatus Dormibacteria bacterium]
MVYGEKRRTVLVVAPPALELHAHRHSHPGYGHHDAEISFV